MSELGPTPIQDDLTLTDYMHKAPISKEACTRSFWVGVNFRGMLFHAVQPPLCAPAWPSVQGALF